MFRAVVCALLVSGCLAVAGKPDVEPSQVPRPTFGLFPCLGDLIRGGSGAAGARPAKRGPAIYDPSALGLPLSQVNRAPASEPKRSP